MSESNLEGLTIEQKLLMPFDVNKLSWRVGATTKDKTKGIPLAYIDARDVMNRLDEVVGVTGWKDSYQEVAGRMLCSLSIKIDGEWITKVDGAGDTHIEAEKGGISDAFKRAAVKFGVGRYLYSLPSQWVKLDSYQKIEETPKLPAWAYPDNYRKIMEKRKAA